MISRLIAVKSVRNDGVTPLNWVVKTAVNNSNTGVSLSSYGYTYGHMNKLAYYNGSFCLASKIPAKSTDGITWTMATDATSNVMGITYGNGYYIAICSITITTYRILRSTDGITWTRHYVANLLQNNNISIGFVNGVFVINSDGATEVYMTSVDGINWTNRSGTAESPIRQIISAGYTTRLQFSTINNVLYAMGPVSSAVYSINGTVWAKASLGTSTQGAVFGTANKRVSLPYSIGSGYASAISTVVTTWTAGVAGNMDTALASGAGTAVPIGGAYGGGLYVVVSNRGTIAKSIDGLIWTNVPNPFGTATEISGIAASDNLIMIISGNSVATSEF